MFIIAAGGNALSLLSDALVLINGPVLRSSRWFFAALFAPCRVLRKVILERGRGEEEWSTEDEGTRGRDGTPTAIIT